MKRSNGLPEEATITDRLDKTLAFVAAFFDGCRFGYEGFEGIATLYRKG